LEEVQEVQEVQFGMYGVNPGNMAHQVVAVGVVEPVGIPSILILDLQLLEMWWLALQESTSMRRELQEDWAKEDRL
jgi:hypothetical protein